MARIFKGTEGTILLHFKHFLDYTPDIHTVVLYTTDVENVVRIHTDIRCDDSFVEVVVKPTDFDNMEDGVINYILEGSDVRVERQSNNYLKTPISNPTTGIQLRKEETLSENGDYTINPDHGYKGMGEVNIHVNVDVETPYNQGFEDGNVIGYETGMRVQKELLETLTVTENGTYTKEDGYNEIIVDVPDLNGDYQTGFDEGYSQGNQAGYDTGYMEGETAGYDSGFEIGKETGVNQAGEIIAETAQVLDITENGKYLTKYSETIYPDTITGIYPNGEEFYNLARLNNVFFNTDIYINNNSKIEIWYKGDEATVHDGWNPIFYGDDSFVLSYVATNYNKMRLVWGRSQYYEFDWDDTILNHVVFSKEGLFVNDIKITDLNDVTFSTSGPCTINGRNVPNESQRYPNGEYGMIKITTDGIENVIIPTADGFLNTTTNEMLKNYYESNEIVEYTETTISEGNPVTGVFDDGTEFYSYATLGGKVFDTGIPVAEDSKIEFWWNDNNENYSSNYYTIIGAQESPGWVMKVCKMSGGNLRYEYSSSAQSFNLDHGRWHHFVMSNKDGFKMDDRIIASGPLNNKFVTNTSPTFYINASYNREIGYNANGKFGVIKITSNGVENVIIPTADGFLNTTTNEMLAVKQEGSYDYAEIIDDGKGNIQTGDGDFYSSLKLEGVSYDTGIDATKDTRIEFWCKPNKNNGFHGLVSSEILKDFKTYECRAYGIQNESSSRLAGILGYMYKPFNKTTDWMHIAMSGDEGVVVNGTKVCGLMKLDSFSKRLYINCPGNTNPIGEYGMIKIDDIVIIPTSNGFLNTNTGEYLNKKIASNEINKYIFIENKIIKPEGNLFKEINVNIQPKVDVGKSGYKFAYSKLTELPEFFDFYNIEDASFMFYGCGNLTKIPSSLKTENIKNTSNMLYGCGKLTVEELRKSFENCLNFESMLDAVPYGKDASFLFDWNIPSVANQNKIISNGDVEYIPAIYNTGINGGYYQSGIIHSYSDFKNLTYFGGYIGRTESLTSDYALPKCPNLSYESCKSILENLYDFTGNGETPTSSQGKLKVHPNFITTIGDEISIGTSKGWLITS